MDLFNEIYDLEDQIREAMKDEPLTGDYNMYAELYGTLVGLLIIDHKDILKRAAQMVLERHTKKEVTVDG